VLAYLDIVLREFLSQRASAAYRWVDGVVNCNLTVLMVQPRVDVLAALLEDLLPQNYRGGSGIGKKVVLGDRATGSNGSSSVVTEVEYPGLDAKPLQVSCNGDTDMAVWREQGDFSEVERAGMGHLRLASGWRPYHSDGNAARVEESARHGAVQLSRGHVLVFGHIVDAVDEGGAFAAVARSVRRNLGGALRMSVLRCVRVELALRTDGMKISAMA
jgi:hypothetical protein